MLEDLAEEMLFKESVITTPKEHDKIIAFTSARTRCQQRLCKKPFFT